jgi:hypothetical protein
VLHSDAAHLHDSAAVAAALAELHGNVGPAGLHAAVDLLQQRGLTELTHMLSLVVHDRWGVLPFKLERLALAPLANLGRAVPRAGREGIKA